MPSENEEQFWSLAQISYEALMIHEQGIILDANQAFAEMFGLQSPDELIGRQGLDVLSLTAESKETIRRHIRSGSTETYEITVVRPDGSMRIAETQGRDLFYRGRQARVVAMHDITDRKRAEEELRISEAKYRSIVETTTEMVWEMDLQGYPTFCNRNTESVLGYSKSEFLQHRPFDFMESQDRDMALARLPELIASKQGWRNWIIRWRHKDGSLRYLESNAEPILDAAGNLIGYRGADRDITERRRVEEALRQSEALYHSLVEQLPQCMFRKDQDGRFTFCNHKFCELLKRDLSEVLGKTDFDLYPIELAEKYRQDDLRIMESGQVWTDIERHRPRSGAEEIFVEVVKSPLSDMTGKISGIQCMFWDVTERHRAAKALRASEARLNEAERLAHLGSWEAELISLEDFSENPLYWSDETSRIFGYEPGTVAVTHELFSNSIHPEDRSGVWAAVQAALREQKPYSAEHRVVRPDGSERTVLENAVLVFDEASGRPLKLIGTVQDVTERKQAEIERTRLEEQIQQAQKMEAVGRLAGGVAHDFNNMLQAILGHAELALIEAPAGSRLRESLMEIQIAGQRSADLTHQLLAFARKQTVSPKVLDLNDTVSGMLKMLHRLIGENIQLLWIPGAGLWSIKMDPSQIDQILANLTVNARDAIANVGKVTIETANVTFDDTYVRRRPECVPGDYVMLAISDTGRGMNEDTQARIFEPFFTTKEFGKGTGLGLAIVFGIVKQNKGFIYAYSEPGQGTTFKLYFPRAEEEAKEAKQPAALRSLRGKETVLLVEDEEQILNIGRLILEEHGYTVLTACTPAAAITLTLEHRQPIHLLITDVVMPGMNGQELKQQLIQSYPDLKCLFVSGYTANAIAHSGVLDDDVHFLQKPFTIRTLAEKVREVLET